MEKAIQSVSLSFLYGSFEGFNFRDQSAIARSLAAEDVVNWDHDRDGEAEFWPSGDNEKISQIFAGRSSVTGGELVALNTLLHEIGDDNDETAIKIVYLSHSCGYSLDEMSAETLENLNTFIFFGDSFLTLRDTAAYELFELFYPDAYKAWQESTCDGLVFDVDRFLGSPSLTVEEVTLGAKKAILVIAE